MKNEPGKNVFDESGINKKLNNLMSFSDFEKSWNSKKQKSTKRTDVGLDIVNEEAEHRDALIGWIVNHTSYTRNYLEKLTLTELSDLYDEKKNFYKNLDKDEIKNVTTRYPHIR